jgi:tripartite-type tricarboxylate transporter receptor subunit TctC
LLSRPGAEHFASGTLRPIAVSTKERSNQLPDTPSIFEAGFGDFDVRGWMGLVGPAGMPGEVVHRLNAEVAAILADAGVAERLRVLGTVARLFPGAAQRLACRRYRQVDGGYR